MTYRVHLSEFEGPLDLLLFFIKRDEINIYDIPISKITEEFLMYLNTMKELDLEIASEFIYIASLLISIKAKILLPRPEIETDELEDYDPRTELVEKLLEYKQLKEASLILRTYENHRQDLFQRSYFEILPTNEITERKATLFDLLQSYLKAIKKSKNVTPHLVQKVPVSIEEQTDFILKKLKEQEKFSFNKVIEQFPEKIYIVVTFLAILELSKNQLIMLLVEDKKYDEFWIARSDYCAEIDKVVT